MERRKNIVNSDGLLTVLFSSKLYNSRHFPGSKVSYATRWPIWNPEKILPTQISWSLPGSTTSQHSVRSFYDRATERFCIERYVAYRSEGAHSAGRKNIVNSGGLLTVLFSFELYNSRLFAGSKVSHAMAHLEPRQNFTGTAEPLEPLKSV